MMLPSQLGLIAFVIEMRYFHWVNTHWSLIIPGIASPFGVFWMTQYLKGSLPKSILESARIDGCGDLMMVFRIVIPNIKPALITLSMLAFLGSFNNYVGPLILLNKESLYTLPLGIKLLSSAFRLDYGAMIAGLSIGTFPVVIIFALGQKSFIQGNHSRGR